MKILSLFNFSGEARAQASGLFIYFKERMIHTTNH
jgi:hypothetical protein